MIMPRPLFVECEQVHAGLAVGDIPAAVEFYTQKLGFTLAFTFGDPPTFAGVNLGKVQMFLQKGTPEPKGCSVYFLVGDAEVLSFADDTLREGAVGAFVGGDLNQVQMERFVVQEAE